MDRLGIVGILMVAACIGSCTRTWVRPGADAADLERLKGRRLQRDGRWGGRGKAG
jgi:hypothetical protein